MARSSTLPGWYPPHYAALIFINSQPLISSEKHHFHQHDSNKIVKLLLHKWAQVKIRIVFKTMLSIYSLVPFQLTQFARKVSFPYSRTPWHSGDSEEAPDSEGDRSWITYHLEGRVFSLWTQDKSILLHRRPNETHVRGLVLNGRRRRKWCQCISLQL